MRTLSTIEISSTLEELSFVAERVSLFCEQAGVYGQVRYDIELCAVEATSNAVIHAYGSEPGLPIRLTLIAEAPYVSLVVEDRGRPLTGEQMAMQLSQVDNGLSESGRGLSIIKAVTDAFSYSSENGHNKLSMSFRVSGAQ